MASFLKKTNWKDVSFAALAQEAPLDIPATNLTPILNHMKPYKKQLESRATEQQWYELQQPQFRFSDFVEFLFALGVIGRAQTLYPAVRLHAFVYLLTTARNRRTHLRNGRRSAPFIRFAYESCVSTLRSSGIRAIS